MELNGLGRYVNSPKGEFLSRNMRENLKRISRFFRKNSFMNSCVNFLKRSYRKTSLLVPGVDHFSNSNSIKLEIYLYNIKNRFYWGHNSDLKIDSI